MKIKVWLKNDLHKDCLFLCDYTNCTQKYVEDNYFLILSAEVEKLTNDIIFENFSHNGLYYDVCEIHSYKDTNHEIKNIFVRPYFHKDSQEIKENPQIENINNAICPVCGYVDYYCWENNSPDENYQCPQCKSKLLLEHKVIGDYDNDSIFYQRTTLKKIHIPKKLKIISIYEVNNGNYIV